MTPTRRMPSRSRPFRMLATLAITSWLGALPARAQAVAPLALRLPATARLAAFGDGFAAGSGADAVFANPARTGRGGLSLGVARFGGAATQGALATATAIGPLGLAVTARWLDYGTDVFPARPGGLTDRGLVDGQSLAAGIAGALDLFGFRLGAAASYVEERIPFSRAGGVAFDVGVSRDAMGLTFALAGQHLGSGLVVNQQQTSLPSRVVAGAALRRRQIGTWFDVSAAAALAVERGGTITPGGGVELLYEPVGGWTGALRLGARRVDGRGSPSLQPFTIGAAFGLDRFSLDYAFEPYRGLGAVHRFGVRIE